MAKRLILMRHAKSSWDDPWRDDHARPLNNRGRRSAAALGDWLRSKGYVPDAVLSSDSRRTRETFAGLGLDLTPDFLPGLYHAEAEAMLDVLRDATGRCVLMIGHNPGIADFAARLVTRRPDHARFDDYPTCATLVADFPQTAWPDVTPGTADPRDFVTPRELG